MDSREKKSPDGMQPPKPFFRPDPLSQVLIGAQLRCFVHGVSKLTAPWGVRFGPPKPEEVKRHFIAQGLEPPPPPPPGSRRPEVAGAFFAVIRGQCWIEAPTDNSRTNLTAGDVAVITRPGPHVLRSDLEAPLKSPFAYADLSKQQRPALRGGGGGPATLFVNGGFVFEDTGRHSLLQALPPIIHVPAEQADNESSLGEAIRLLARELNSGKPGTDCILNHFAHIILAQVVRTELLRRPKNEQGSWFLGMRDPQVGEVMSLMYTRPDLPWTVASLADAVAMSRSAFAKRFHEVVGESPMSYLTARRMEFAKVQLMEGRQPIKTIAQQAGYASVSSFSNAFKKSVGVSPGAFRRGDIEDDETE